MEGEAGQEGGTGEGGGVEEGRWGASRPGHPNCALFWVNQPAQSRPVGHVFRHLRLDGRQMVGGGA